MSLKDQAKATMDAGYRGSRVDAEIGGAIADRVSNTHERVRLVAQVCKEIREGVGPHGDWMIDFHQKFDYADARRALSAGHPQPAPDDHLSADRG